MASSSPTSSVYTFEDSLEDYANSSQCQHFVDDMRRFNRSYMAFLISVGLLGNFLTILVFMASKLRHVPSSHYLTALAAADIGVLTCRWLASLQTDYPHVMMGTCQLLMYANNVFTCLSVWYVVGFTIERFVAVRYPLARLRWCTVRLAKLFIFTATFVAILYYLYFFILVRVQRSHFQIQAAEDDSSGSNSSAEPYWETDTICDVLPKYLQVALTLNYADSILTLILPLLLILGFNASIATKLLCPNGRNSHSSGHVTDDETVFSLSSSTPGCSKTRAGTSGTPKNGHSPDYLPVRDGYGHAAALLQASVVAIDFRRHGGGSKRVDERVTRLLFVISSAFVIMNMPDHIVRMLTFTLVASGKWKHMSPTGRCHFELCQQVTNTIFYSYFAVNFVLYNVVGVNFRRELRVLLRRCLAICCRTFARRQFTFSVTFSRQSISSSKVAHARVSQKEKSYELSPMKQSDENGSLLNAQGGLSSQAMTPVC